MNTLVAVSIPQIKVEESWEQAQKLGLQGGHQAVDQTSFPELAKSIEDTKNTITQATEQAHDIPTDIVNQKNTTIEHGTETLITNVHQGMNNLVGSVSGNPVIRLGDQMGDEAQVQYFYVMVAVGFPRKQVEKYWEQLLTLLKPLLLVLG